MTETYKYFNDDNDEITEATARQLGEFSKEIYQDGLQKICEMYSNGVIHHIEYYLASTEELNSALIQQYAELTYPVIYVISIGTSSGYNASDCYEYTNGELTDHFKVCAIDGGDLIASQSFNIDDESLSVADKFEYDSVTGEFIYLYEYVGNDLTFITDMEEDGEGSFSVKSLATRPWWSWSGREYYQYANPLVPDGPI